MLILYEPSETDGLIYSCGTYILHIGTSFPGYESHILGRSSFVVPVLLPARAKDLHLQNSQLPIFIFKHNISNMLRIESEGPIES